MKVIYLNQLPEDIIIYINNYIPIKKCDYCSNNVVSFYSYNIYCSYYCCFLNTSINFSFNNY